MYAETALMLSYFPSLRREVLQQHYGFCSPEKTCSSSGVSISGYNLLGGGDLFKAPEPIIEESVMGLDPMMAAMSMISCGEDVMPPPQSLTVSDVESSIQSGKILSEVFYECRKDLLAKDGNETPLSEVLNIDLPHGEQNVIKLNGEACSCSFQNCVSSQCLHSMENVNQAPVMPNFLYFPAMDFAGANGMRRAFSEGDIKTPGNKTATTTTTTTNLLYFPPPGQPHSSTTTVVSKERSEKLSRYRLKKAKRNFGHKIKYACRKTLADSQPRVRGRFARTEG